MVSVMISPSKLKREAKIIKTVRVRLLCAWIVLCCPLRGCRFPGSSGGCAPVADRLITGGLNDAASWSSSLDRYSYFTCIIDAMFHRDEFLSSGFWTLRRGTCSREELDFEFFYEHCFSSICCAFCCPLIRIVQEKMAALAQTMAELGCHSSAAPNAAAAAAAAAAPSDADSGSSSARAGDQMVAQWSRGEDHLTRFAANRLN